MNRARSSVRSRLASLAGLLAVTAGAPSASAALLISQISEGTSFNKFLELFNSGATEVDLSQYYLALFSNANRENWKSGTPPSGTQQFQLPAQMLGPGQHFLLKNSGAAIPDYAATNANAAADSVINFNGDDSVVLYLGNTWTTDTIQDAFSLSATNQAMDKSFHRLSNDVGYDLTIGTSSVVEFVAVWETKTLAEVASAAPADPWYLQFKPTALPPVLETFTLSSDAADTVSPLVNLTVTSSGGAPTEYRVSESATFVGAIWPGLGAKTVFLQLRNANGESAVLNDAITRVDYVYAPEVVISQYYEGSSNNKYLELSNLTNGSVSLDGWTLARWSNAAAEGWKTSGPGAASISLTGLALAPLGTLVIAHDLATFPLLDPPPALLTGDLSFNGDDSMTLHDSSVVDPSTLVDAVSILSTGDPTGAGVGKDTSFVRISPAQGFGFSVGSNVTQFPSVWQQVAMAEVDGATNDQNTYLGTYPGGLPPLGGYESWAASYVGLGGRTSDDDGDTLTNVVEYAMGSDPEIAGIPYTITLNGSGKPRLTVPKGAIAASDSQLSYQSEASTTLASGSWSVADITVTHSPTQFVIEYTGADPTAFLRFKAVLAP
jgi:hypothetical protein